MNPDTNPIQRLIDGELADDERQQLLLHLDAEAPEQWRDLALGFVEAQMFREALVSKPEAAIEASPPATGWTHRITGLAAAVAIGLAIGWLAFANPPESVPLADDQDKAPTPPTLPDESALPRLSTLEIADADGARREAPMIDGSAGPRQAEQALYVAQEPVRRLEAGLREQGFAPEVTTAYVSAELDDGRRLIFPVNRLTLDRGTAPPSPESH